MDNTIRWTIMTILLIIGFVAYDPEEMFWTWLIWAAMAAIIAIDFSMWRKKRKDLKQKK